MVEMAEQAAYYYCNEVEFDPKASAKFLTEVQQPVFTSTLEKLSALDTWQEDSIEEALGKVMDDTGLKFGKIAQPLRVALTGNTVSPSICLVMAVMGKEMALARITRASATLA
jgi:glutamyl-tRNA synthetase